MPSVLCQFRKFDGDTRVEYQQQSEKVDESSSQPTSAWGRFCDWKHRTREQKEANKATTLKFIDDLKKEYGEKIANFSTRQLASHVKEGKPLTGRRIQIVLKDAEKARKSILLRNTRMFDKLAPQMVDTAVREMFNLEEGQEIPLSKEDLQSIVDRAGQRVEDAPRFQQVGSRSEESFMRRFAGVVKHAVEASYIKEAEGMEGLDALKSLITPGRFAKMQDIHQKILHLGLPETGQQDSEQGLVFGLHTITQSARNIHALSAGGVRLHFPQDVNCFMGTRKGLNIALQELGKLDLEKGHGKEFAEALITDGSALLEEMDRSLGFDKLSSQDLDKVIQATDTLREWGEAIGGFLKDQGGTLSVFENRENLATILNNQRKILKSITTDDPQANGSIRALKKHCDSLLSKLPEIQNQIETHKNDLQLLSRASRLTSNMPKENKEVDRTALNSMSTEINERLDSLRQRLKQDPQNQAVDALHSLLLQSRAGVRDLLAGLKD